MADHSVQHAVKIEPQQSIDFCGLAIRRHGEKYRRLIVSALSFLDEQEPNWALDSPIDREQYIENLVAAAHYPQGEDTMSLYQRIAEDRNEARRLSQSERRDTLGYLMSEAKALAKKSHPSRDPTDDEVLRTVRSLIKKNDEVLALRDEPGTREENRLLLGYLPELMEETELKAAIEGIVSALPDRSPKQMGTIMRQLKEKHLGQYDPAMASQITKSLLQG